MSRVAGNAYAELERQVAQASATRFVQELATKYEEQYSIARLVRSLADGAGKHEAVFEHEVSAELMRLTGQAGAAGNSVLVPTAFVFGRRGQSLPQTTHGSMRDPMQVRDLNVASAGGGGYLVNTEIAGVIEMLRARSIVGRLGATILPGLVGNALLPKFVTGMSVTWLANEAAGPTEGAPLLGVAALAPKNVAAYVEVSRQLLKQAPLADQVIRRDLAAALGAAIDAAAINGSGASGQPLGLLQVGAVNSVTGTSIDWSDVLTFIENAADANTELSGFITTGAVYKLLSAREKATGSGMIAADGRIDGRPLAHSTGVPAATLIGGPWEELIVGEWGVLDLSSDSFTKFQSAIVGVRAIFTVDIGLRHPAAFTAATSIT